MRLGTVRFYDDLAGYGYITPSNGGQEFSVYAHGIVDQIRPDNIVQFDIEFTKQGVEAVKVKVLTA